MTPRLATAAALALTAAALSAQTVTVDTLEDGVDIPASATLADLPGPDGRTTFREALLVTNNMPGPQTVAFAIPTDEWWLYDDVALLRLEDGVFPVTDDDTTLDFGTQADFTGDTNPDGREVGIYGLQPNGWGAPAILVTGERCVVKGLGPVHLRATSVSFWGGTHHRVVDCVTDVVEIEGSSFVTVGGTEPGEGNVLDGVSIVCDSHDNLVIGNTVSSVSVVGSPYCSVERPARNRIGGPTPAERNVMNGTGSYCCEGFPVGQNVLVSWARDTVVEGNFIGTTADGLTRVPQIGPSGVEIVDSIDTVVRDNLIAGMRVVGQNHYAGDVFGQAVEIGALNGDTTGVTITGNLIGTDVTGEAPLVTYQGIVVSAAVASRTISGVTIGGEAPGDANVVAFTQRNGVTVSGSTTSATLRGNSIHGNDLLGIDLGSFFGGPDGVSPNDPLDVDDGGNGLQNWPTVDVVTHVGGAVEVVGALDSSPGEAFTVELFADDVCDPSGHGEGREFLGSVDVVTDGAGHAEYTATVADVAAGWAVSATATRQASSETSEFGPCASAVWSDVGSATPGVAGPPRLRGAGDLTTHGTQTVALSAAAPSSSTAVFSGLASAPVPFKGGTLVPQLGLVPPLFVMTSGLGALELSFVMPAGVASGTELWLQAAVADAAAPQGVALSNALVGRVP